MECTISPIFWAYTRVLLCMCTCARVFGVYYLPDLWWYTRVLFVCVYLSSTVSTRQNFWCTICAIFGGCTSALLVLTCVCYPIHVWEMHVGQERVANGTYDGPHKLLLTIRTMVMGFPSKYLCKSFTFTLNIKGDLLGTKLFVFQSVICHFKFFCFNILWVFL